MTSKAMLFAIGAVGVVAGGLAVAAPQYDQRGYQQGRGGSTIRCESTSGRTQRCPTGNSDVRLARQLSNAQCIEGRTWGRDRDSVWVSQGCRADFTTTGRGGGYGNGNGYGNSGGTIRCKSDDFRYRHCNADTRGGVQIARRISKADCVQGRNWGYDRNGVWVDQGCDAEFVVGRGGGRYGDGGRNDDGRWSGGGDTVRCKSDNFRYRHCDANTRGGVQLLRQISQTQCVRGSSWGSDANGVWVSNGCEAEFRVGR